MSLPFSSAKYYCRKTISRNILCRVQEQEMRRQRSVSDIEEVSDKEQRVGRTRDDTIVDVRDKLTRVSQLLLNVDDATMVALEAILDQALDVAIHNVTNNLDVLPRDVLLRTLNAFSTSDLRSFCSTSTSFRALCKKYHLLERRKSQATVDAFLKGEKDEDSDIVMLVVNNSAGTATVCDVIYHGDDADAWLVYDWPDVRNSDDVDMYLRNAGTGASSWVHADHFHYRTFYYTNAGIGFMIVPRPQKGDEAYMKFDVCPNSTSTIRGAWERVIARLLDMKMFEGANGDELRMWYNNFSRNCTVEQLQLEDRKAYTSSAQDVFPYTSLHFETLLLVELFLDELGIYNMTDDQRDEMFETYEDLGRSLKY